MSKYMMLVLIWCVPILSRSSLEPKPSGRGSTKEIVKVKRDIYFYIDSLLEIYPISRQFVVDVGQNESGWRNPDDSTYIRMCGVPGEDSQGDLQVNMKYWDHWSAIYDIKEPTRIGLLEAGIRIMYDLHEEHNSYIKTRMIYGRGHWIPRSKWSKIERHFMNMDWGSYE